MTVPSAVSKSGPYTGNGVTTSFTYGFRILDASHIQVVRTEGGVDTILTTGFTVTGVGNPNGNVVFAVAPTAAQTITLIRNAPFVQQTDLENQGAYYAQTIEDALDLGVMRDQQLQEQIDRAVKLPVGTVTFDLDALVADIVRVADSVDNVDVVAAGIADVDVVAANVADVGIVADNIADVTNFADVYQGPKAVPPTLRNDGSALQLGDLYFDTVENRMKVRASAAWINAASSVNGMIAQYSYTATAGQTVFAAVYDIGFVTVYLNGVKLVANDDFTATNGTTVVLATGAAVGDSIEIIGFGAFSTADMLQKSQNGADIPNKPAFLVNLGVTATAAELNALDGMTLTAAQINEGVVPPGAIQPFARRSAPAGWLKANGAAVSRAAYSALFDAICPVIGNPTISIASPGVLTLNGHGLINGDRVRLSTTGALPTGLNTTTDYFVVNSTTNTFQLSLTLGGAAINTSGSQSGVHTVRSFPYGAGDGSTTFNLPEMRGEFLRGWDDGRGVDAGRVLGSAQAQEIQSHSHVISGTASMSATFAAGTVMLAQGTGLPSAATGGAEARPRNVSGLVCIKF